MKEPLTPKVALLSALFAVLLIPFAVLLNLGMEWFFNHVVSWVLNWFNTLNIFFKILVLFIGGFSLFMLLLSLFKIIGRVLSYFIFDKLPENLFTIIYSTLIFLANVTLSVISLWRVIAHFNFWVVCEFIVLVGFIVSANTILMPWYRKEMAKIKAREQS